MKPGYEHIYNVATGLEKPAAFDARHCIARRKCDLLFEAAYAARKSIAQHMGVDFDEESPDVHRLIDTYERMMHILGRYFYECGRRAGRHRRQPPQRSQNRCGKRGPI